MSVAINDEWGSDAQEKPARQRNATEEEALRIANDRDPHHARKYSDAIDNVIDLTEKRDGCLDDWNTADANFVNLIEATKKPRSYTIKLTVKDSVTKKKETFEVEVPEGQDPLSVVTELSRQAQNYIMQPRQKVRGFVAERAAAKDKARKQYDSFAEQLRKATVKRDEMYEGIVQRSGHNLRTGSNLDTPLRALKHVTVSPGEEKQS